MSNNTLIQSPLSFFRQGSCVSPTRGDDDHKLMSTANDLYHCQSIRLSLFFFFLEHVNDLFICGSRGTVCYLSKYLWRICGSIIKTLWKGPCLHLNSMGEEPKGESPVDLKRRVTTHEILAEMCERPLQGPGPQRLRQGYLTFSHYSTCSPWLNRYFSCR